jgi:hypothetical protein
MSSIPSCATQSTTELNAPSWAIRYAASTTSSMRIEVRALEVLRARDCLLRDEVLGTDLSTRKA